MDVGMAMGMGMGVDRRRGHAGSSVGLAGGAGKTLLRASEHMLALDDRFEVVAPA